MQFSRVSIFAFIIAAPLGLAACASSDPTAEEVASAAKQFAALRSTAAPRSTLNVVVSELTPAAGFVRVGLYDASLPFAREGIHLVDRVVPAKGNVTTAVFEDIPYGAYAVAVIHDIDGNGRLNRTMFGMPAEPIGFSNGARAGFFGPPSFADARFEVSAPVVKVPVTVK